MLLHHMGQQKARKHLLMLVLWTLLDYKKPADGARGRSRTGTLSPASDFESDASTNFATRAVGVHYNAPYEFLHK